MNKSWIIFFCLNSIISLSSALGEETIIILEAKDARKNEMHKDIVIIKDSEVIVNREKLTPAEVITQSDSIRVISTFIADDKTKPCDAGVFRHILKKEKIVKVEHGCLGNLRYNHLMKNFKAVKKDTLTK